MSRFIALCIVLFTASLTFGQTETGYITSMPGSLFADGYQYNIQKLYESLPKIGDANNVPDTSTLDTTALALDSTALFLIVVIAAIVVVIVVIVLVTIVVVLVAIVAVTLMKNK